MQVAGMQVRGLPDLDRCVVMGVLNVTPDSFSDGGAWLDPNRALAHGLAMSAQGADIVDVGGESTRPGAVRVDEDEELRRVLPVLCALARAGVTVSVDTTRASVAAAAIDAGAGLVNDVSGALADPGIAEVVAAADVPFIAMHWRGQSADMQSRASYDDVVADVCAELSTRLAALATAGVDPEQVILDPGLGFAKSAEHNWALLAHLDALRRLGRPLLLGASRKSFLGTLLGGPDGPRPAAERDSASTAIAALAAYQGVWGVRVHDVAAAADAVRVAAALRAAGATRLDPAADTR